MTAIVTFVDIAGYFDVFAIFRVRTHLADFVGATNRPVLIEHRPLSDHVFLPLEIERTNHVRGVFDFFATVVFNTVNPGRTTSGCDDAALIKPCACEATENE